MKLNLYFLILVLLFVKAVLGNNVAFADSVFYAGEYEKAITLYNKCLAVNNDLDAVTKGTIFLRKGVAYDNLKNNDAAFNEYFTALKYFETSKNTLGQAKTYVNLASLYFTIHDFTNTEKYIIKGEEKFNQLRDTVNLIRVYGTKALLYKETVTSRKAIETRLYALTHFKKYFDVELESNYYFNLADDYSLFNKDSALYFYNKTLAIIKTSGDSTLLPGVFVNIGSIYLEKEELQQANIFLQKALKTVDVENDSVPAKEMYKYLSLYYYKTGSYKKAYEYADSAKLYSDALFNKEKTTLFAELSEKYEAEKKDATITRQQKENNTKTKGLIAIAIGLGIVGLLALFSYKQFRKKQKINSLLEKQNDAIQNLNQQLHQANQTKVSLFSIISHDLRAPLSSLYALLQTQNLQQKNTEGNTAVTKQTEQLLETLENLLLWSKTQLEQFHTQITTAHLVSTFKDIEQLYSPIIISKKITIEHHIIGEGKLQTDQDILNVIVRNIYSNALQNALPNSVITMQHRCFENLHIVECSNYYDASITNNTIYFSEKGLGKTLIKDFCAKINATVHFSAGESQFTVLLKVPSIGSI